MTASSWPHAIILAPLIVAATLGSSGWIKRNQGGSVHSAMKLLKTPKWLRGMWLAKAIPWIELALALLLLVTPAPIFALVALAALVLAAIYWVLIARALTWEKRPSCGCFGKIGEANISWRTLFRNTLLVLAAGLSLAAGITGYSAFGALRGFGGDDLAWLVGALGCAAMTWGVVARSKVVAPPEVWIEEPDDERDNGEYVRRPIPSVSLMTNGTTRPLSLMSNERARLIVHVGTDGNSKRIVDELGTLGIPAEVLGVHPLVDVAQGPAFASRYPHLEEQLIMAQPGQRAAMGLNTIPAAVVYGTDGLTAGGPESGVENIRALMSELQEALGAHPAAGRVREERADSNAD